MFHMKNLVAHSAFGRPMEKQAFGLAKRLAVGGVKNAPKAALGSVKAPFTLPYRGLRGLGVRKPLALAGAGVGGTFLTGGLINNRDKYFDAGLDGLYAAASSVNDARKGISDGLYDLVKDDWDHFKVYNRDGINTLGNFYDAAKGGFRNIYMDPNSAWGRFMNDSVGEFIRNPGAVLGGGLRSVGSGIGSAIDSAGSWYHGR